MDTCVENQILAPTLESQRADRVGQPGDRPASSSAEEENREAGDRPAAPSHTAPPQTPQPEPASEKNPWSAWAWLGLCKAPTRKIPNIVHVDVDAFFASVEQVLNPRLRGKPVLVGRGCVASASYEAKALGVKTAMSFREALRVCPKAIVLPGQYEHYADSAERVRRILESYTPAVEPAALDDFYLDFAGTERLYSDYEATLRRL